MAVAPRNDGRRCGRDIQSISPSRPRAGRSVWLRCPAVGMWASPSPIAGGKDRRVGSTAVAERDRDRYRLISADSHVNEPGDLWTTRVAARYVDRAPRIESFEQGDAW